MPEIGHMIEEEEQKEIERERERKRKIPVSLSPDPVSITSQNIDDLEGSGFDTDDEAEEEQDIEPAEQEPQIVPQNTTITPTILSPETKQKIEIENINSNNNSTPSKDQTDNEISEVLDTKESTTVSPTTMSRKEILLTRLKEIIEKVRSQREGEDTTVENLDEISPTSPTTTIAMTISQPENNDTTVKISTRNNTLPCYAFSYRENLFTYPDNKYLINTCRDQCHEYNPDFGFANHYGHCWCGPLTGNEVSDERHGWIIKMPEESDMKCHSLCRRVEEVLCPYDLEIARFDEKMSSTETTTTMNMTSSTIMISTTKPQIFRPGQYDPEIRFLGNTCPTSFNSDPDYTFYNETWEYGNVKCAYGRPYITSTDAFCGQRSLRKFTLNRSGRQFLFLANRIRLTGLNEDNRCHEEKYQGFKPQDYMHLCFAYKGFFSNILKPGDARYPASFIQVSYSYLPAGSTGNPDLASEERKRFNNVNQWINELDITPTTINNWKYVCMNLLTNFYETINWQSKYDNSPFLYKNGATDHRIEEIYFRMNHTVNETVFIDNLSISRTRPPVELETAVEKVIMADGQDLDFYQTMKMLKLSTAPPGMTEAMEPPTTMTTTSTTMTSPAKPTFINTTIENPLEAFKTAFPPLPTTTTKPIYRTTPCYIDDTFRGRLNQSPELTSWCINKCRQYNPVFRITIHYGFCFCGEPVLYKKPLDSLCYPICYVNHPDAKVCAKKAFLENVVRQVNPLPPVTSQKDEPWVPILNNFDIRNPFGIKNRPEISRGEEKDDDQWVSFGDRDLERENKEQEDEDFWIKIVTTTTPAPTTTTKFYPDVPCYADNRHRPDLFDYPRTKKYITWCKGRCEQYNPNYGYANHYGYCWCGPIIGSSKNGLILRMPESHNRKCHRVCHKLHSVCPYEIEQVRIREEEEENYVIEYDEYEEIEFEYEDDRNEDEYDPNHDFMPKLPPQRKPAPTRPPRITKPQTTTVYRPPNQVKSESRVINREPGEVDPDIPSFFLQKEVLLVSAGLVFVIGFALAVGLVSCAKKRQERQAEADRVRRENDRRARREQRNGNVGGQGSNGNNGRNNPNNRNGNSNNNSQNQNAVSETPPDYAEMYPNYANNDYSATAPPASAPNFVNEQLPEYTTEDPNIFNTNLPRSHNMTPEPSAPLEEDFDLPSYNGGVVGGRMV